MRKTLFKPMADKLTRKMAIACVIGFGGFALWGGFAPLEEGISASGQIVVEDNRQVVQHLEGGLVRDIRVREGQFVSQGDVLVVLSKTSALSTRDQVVQEYAARAASVARLRALQKGAARPDFSVLETLDLGEVERENIIRRESELFDQQKNALSADVAVLNARIKAAEQTTLSRGRQMEIAQTALDSAISERDVIQEIFAKKLARKDRLTQAERLVANLEGEIARLKSDRENAQASMLDHRAQIAQTRARAAREIAEDLLETNTRLLAAEEQLGEAQDILNRSEIIAPVSGEVLNMSFATIGAVVKPAETLMEIVPDIGEVTAAVKIAVTDRANVREGQLVRTQFSSYKGWQAPRLDGKIIDISADLKVDPITAISYYEAKIRVPKSEIARTEGIDILPGIPVDVFIYSGKSRTLMDYLFEPLGESLYRGLRRS